MTIAPTEPLPLGPFATSQTGGTGNDTLNGTALNDYLAGGDGDDRLFALDGNDFLDGGDGDDRLVGGRDNDTLIGGAGADVLTGTQGYDELYGGDGADLLTSGVQTSLLVGGAGDDTLAARLQGGGDHTLFGGADGDLFDLVGAADASVSAIVIGDFELGVDSFRVDGTADTAIMAAGVALTATGTGTMLTLATGDSLHFDGLGLQPLEFAYGLAGSDTITGGTTAERLNGGEGDNIVDGGGGDDLVYAGDGNDTLSGGDGSDTVNGGRGDDLLSGGDGDDFLSGVAGLDTISGGAGADTIYSSKDSTVVDGGDGADVIAARMNGGGDHDLTGGAGADLFDFVLLASRKNSHTTITDFVIGEDGVQMMGVDLGAYMQVRELAFETVEEGARVTFGNAAGSITFAGQDAEALNLWYLTGQPLFTH